MDKQELLAFWKRNKMFSKKLINAFLSVKREDFVPEEIRELAYEDMPLEIMKGQTISQPTTVMLMLKWLNCRKKDKVLEIGAGSGYNAALLSKLCKKVITIEYNPDLAEYARKNIEKAGIKNVEVICGDGSVGYKEEAPYDKIIVTCACPQIEPEWLSQLNEEGVILAPVGYFQQDMIKITKKEGKYYKKNLGKFMFVPMKGKKGF